MQTPFPTPQPIGPPAGPSGQNPLNMLLVKLLQGLLQSQGGTPPPSASPVGIEDILKLLSAQGPQTPQTPQMPVRLNPVATPPVMPPPLSTPAPMSAPFGEVPNG